jgi:hypothetical protein
VKKEIYITSQIIEFHCQNPYQQSTFEQKKKKKDAKSCNRTIACDRENMFQL